VEALLSGMSRKRGVILLINGKDRTRKYDKLGVLIDRRFTYERN